MNIGRFFCVHGWCRSAAVLAVLCSTACVPQYPPPQQVQASNPTVTYKYHTDQDLLQVEQTAGTFCSQYQSVPQVGRFATDPDGSKVVVFQCVRAMTQTIPATPYSPNLSYTYRADPDLLDAARNAQSYCAANGRQQVTSGITNNVDGSRTVTFRCSPG